MQNRWAIAHSENSPEHLALFKQFRFFEVSTLQRLQQNFGTATRCYEHVASVKSSSSQ